MIIRINRSDPVALSGWHKEETVLHPQWRENTRRDVVRLALLRYDFHNPSIVAIPAPL